MDGRPNCRNKAAFSNVSGLKRVFEKLYFLDGLVWTVSLTVEIKCGVVWTILVYFHCFYPSVFMLLGKAL